MDVYDVIQADKMGHVAREVYLLQWLAQVRRESHEQRHASFHRQVAFTSAWVVVVAAAVETVCQELHEDVPAWTGIVSDTPIYIPEVPAESPAAAVLRRASPPIFIRHNVFVPATFMDRR